MRKKVSLQKLLSKFYYRDGILYRKISDSPVGTLDPSNGYLKCSIGRKNYYVHTIIFAITKGYFPENYIDHINKNRLDNNINNLREVTASCNVRNSTRSPGASGFRGVYYRVDRGSYSARINLNKREIHLGTFKVLEDAVIYKFSIEVCLGLQECSGEEFTKLVEKLEVFKYDL